MCGKVRWRKGGPSSVAKRIVGPSVGGVADMVVGGWDQWLWYGVWGWRRQKVDNMLEIHVGMAVGIVLLCALVGFSLKISQSSLWDLD